jgi:transcriptional regulator with XRE-family HTH domain
MEELTPDKMRAAVRVARKEFGLTQARLAKEAGIAQPRFSAYESGLADLSAEQIQTVLKTLESAHKSQVGSILQGGFDIRTYSQRPEDLDSDPKTMRIHADISQEELAKRAKVSRAKIRAWENRRSYYLDQTKWFDEEERLRVLDVLCKALDSAEKKFATTQASAKYESFKRTQAATHEAYGFAQMSEYHFEVVARYEKIIAIQDEQIAGYQQQLAPELRKKDARIADLERELAERHAVWDLGVQEALEHEVATAAVEKAAATRAKLEGLLAKVSVPDVKGEEE